MVKLVNSTGKWFSTVDKISLTLQNVTDTIADGGEIYNYPIFAKMTDNKYNATIPAWLQPDVPPDGYTAPKVRDWLTTKGRLIDGLWYCILSHNKSWIKCSDALRIADIAGVTLMHEDGYKLAVQSIEELI